MVTRLPHAARGQTEQCQVIIVGGGPVGLFLGCRLAQLGVPFTILEREPRRRAGSRSIGIHPPALERLAVLGLADELVVRGVPVRRGRAIGDRGPLGTVDFSRCRGRYPFVLAVPQAVTEAVLERRLGQLRPGALRRDAQVRRVEGCGDGAEVTLAGGEHLAGRFVVGCDGKRSKVRAALGVPLEGRALPGAFAMGDFDDDTDLGAEAAVYLCDDGLVESFPLPGRQRRWVAELGPGDPQPDPAALGALLRRRTGVSVGADRCHMLSLFGIEQRMAPRFARSPLALAGDAAHVVSPLGGQGMNLGWLDAWALAETLASVEGGASADLAFADYDRRRRRVARSVLRRGAFNTAVGRRPRWPRLRNAAVRAMLWGPGTRAAAAVFTMRGL